MAERLGGGRKMEDRVGGSIGMDHGGRTRGGSIKIDEEGPRKSN